MCTIMCYCHPQADYSRFAGGLSRTVSRGPDAERILRVRGGLMGFQRLSIMGLTESGMQPFSLNGNFLVCNGEIYGFRRIKEDLIQKGRHFESDSDCEVLLFLYEEMGTGGFT